LILVERAPGARLPWETDLRVLIRTYSTNQDYVAYDTVTELESRGLVVVSGRAQTETLVHRQTVCDYVESFHSRNGFSRARLCAERAQEFDAQLTTLVRRSCPDDIVHVPVRARITWVRPLNPD
jgi:hypothetical protein